MDIKKEVQEFKAVATSMGWNIDGEKSNNGHKFYCLTTNSGWEMWQAAKAQTIPEGFVLVLVAVVKRCMSHISIATCHPNNTKQEELVMNDDMEFLEKAMLEAAEGE